MSVHFSSEKMDWGTPQAFYDRLHKEFGFDLDVACTRKNCKAMSGLFVESFDALSEPWNRHGWTAWMNPPYGREIGKWMQKAYEESRSGIMVVCLVPSRTDTKWWHDYAMKADEIRLIKGRLTFEGAPSPAPFPSAVVIFKPINYQTRFTAMNATPQSL